MPTRTESALVAVFDGTSQAQAAAAELTANGFAGDHIHIASSDAKVRVESISTPAVRSHQRGVDDLLEEVCGERRDTKLYQYEQAVDEGKALLGVRTPMQMKDKATEILSHYGSVDDVRLENTVQSPQHTDRSAVVGVSRHY